MISNMSWLQRLMRHKRSTSTMISGSVMRVPFVSPVMETQLSPSFPGAPPITSEQFNHALTALSDECITNSVLKHASDAQLQTPLDGGRHTAANVLYFKLQTSHFWRHRRHLDMLEESPHFQLLKKGFKLGIAEYLQRCGFGEDECEVCAALLWRIELFGHRRRSLMSDS